MDCDAQSRDQARYGTSGIRLPRERKGCDASRGEQMRRSYLLMASALALAAALSSVTAQSSLSSVPKTWDELAIETLEVPLANPIGSPKHLPADYYYRIPVAPIYRNYRVYAPGREPAGYFDSLKQQTPEIVWDDAGHRPPLETEADWIRAGEIVFDAPVQTGVGPIV